MKKLLRNFAIFSFLVLTTPFSLAELYKWVDEDGLPCFHENNNWLIESEK